MCERWFHPSYSGLERFANPQVAAGCKKASRECTYPEPRSTPRPSTRSKRDQTVTDAGDSRSASDENEFSDGSERRRREGEVREPGAPSLKMSQPEQASIKSESSSLAEQLQPSEERFKVESSLSPSTETSSASASAGWSEKIEKSSSVSTDLSHEDKAWSHLSQDLQFYLEYHTTRLTYHHYFFKHDANHFLHNILIEHALQYEPLLYAVVGFAAFHSTVARADGRIQDFLGYYNISVSLLRRSLVEKQKHTDATMLTILQLATFEVRQNTCLSNRADNVQRITWGIRSAYSVIKKPPTECFWNYTRLTLLWRQRCAGRF